MSYFFAFAGFAVLIILHEVGHFSAAKAVGMRVERFALFFPPLLLKKKFGETEYGVGAIPLGGYVKITGMNPEEELPAEIAKRAYYGQPIWKRIVVIAAGPAMNVLVAFLILFFLGLFAAKQAQPLVGETVRDSAARGVLKPGDRIVSVDGKKGGVETIHDQIAKHRCQQQRSGCRAATPVKLVIERNGQKIPVQLTPRYYTDTAPHGMRVGIVYKIGPAHYSVGKAAGQSVKTMWSITSQTFAVFSHLFDAKERKKISGVVGTYKVTQEYFSFNMIAALYVLALISLSLAIINLFPFLPLDGGHIFFSLAEKVRGKRISFETMQRASVFGFMLVLMLAAIGLSNDISHLSNGGFNVR